MSYIVAISLILLLWLLVQNKVKPAIAFFGLVLLYYFLGFIKLEAMLANFVNTALITLLLLLTVSQVLEKTTFIATLANKLFSKSFAKSYLKTGILTSFLSAFLNNTAVVASMISVIQKNRFHAPSKLLIPLSYAAILGGTVTLIGTSTNLIVNGLMIERGLEPFELFDFFYVGIFIVIFGLFTVYFITKFLPDNVMQKEQKNYFIQAKVKSNSKLIGKSIKQNGLRNLEYLFLSEIVREGRVLPSVTPDEVILADDILVFSGDVKEIKILHRFDGLAFEHSRLELNRNLVETIISHESTLVGKKIKESNFRTKFDATVVAVKRGDEKLSGKIGEIVLKTGDSLVLAVGNDFYSRENLKKNFYFTNDFSVKNMLNFKQSFIAVFGFFGVIVLSVLNVVTLVKGLFVLLAAFVVLGYIDFNEIKRRFPYDLVLIIGSALGISAVIIDSGLSRQVSDALQYAFGGFGVYGAFIAVYLLAFILTEIITNNAAAALAFPVAYSVVSTLDVNMMPFMLAVAYGASASFMTPYGYQTNLMVSSVGGYGFNDFIKSGVWLSLVYSLTALVLIPYFFPF